MSRRHSATRSASRTSFAVLAAAAVIGVCIWSYKSFSSRATASPTDVSVPSIASAVTPASAASSAQLEQGPPQVTLVSNNGTTSGTGSPTTQPSTQPSNLTNAIPPRLAPTGDAATILRNGAAKRDAGDLVTARDMVSDALNAGRFDGASVQDAKDFIGALNDKIIFGTQKFSADSYNGEWKVEPGTALWKLAKRFDVTAELLCRVNGLSRPDKLRAGVTIKTIKGPFHLVVSKKTFDADIYLGAPGGPGSLFVKTVRVGLGSDNSTPKGLWQVDTGKVVNPVYYSSRGEGVVAADDPKNPLGERWIPLKGIEGECVGKESYGIHGTIDPASIGKNMSQGCIRLASDDINLLYDLLIENKSQVRVVD